MPIKVAPKPITCPHCGVVLDIEPVRKRKCPECRETIVPKQAPGKGYKLFFTEEQAAAIDMQVAQARKDERLRYLRIELRSAEKAKQAYAAWIFRGEIARLEEDRDTAWRCWNEAAMEAAKNLEGYGYRRARFEQAQQLLAEHRGTAAIGFLSEILYLDYCRVTNVWLTDGHDRRLQIPFFEHNVAAAAKKINATYGLEDHGPNPAFTPDVINMLAKVMRNEEYSIEQVEKLFFDRCNSIRKDLRAPYPAADAWRELREYLV